MKIVGLLLIANSLILCAFWVFGQNANKGWAITVTLIAIFAGIFLMVSERTTEVSVQGVGTIKAAAASAKADAHEIEQIKQRVENQSATIDMVAAKASEAQALTEKLKRVLDFSVQIQKVFADDRTAFEGLQPYVDEHSELSPIAAYAYVAARVTAGGPIEPGFLHLPQGDRLYTATNLDEIRQLYSMLAPIYRPHGVILATNNANIDVNDKLKFCLDVLKADPSLQATNIAAKFAAKETNSQWEPFNVQPLIAKINERIERK